MIRSWRSEYESQSLMRVLLVDDHKLVRQGTRLYLESQGIEVVAEATNGHEAVAMARDLMPDVVIMDIRLPELSGVEATRRIRQEQPDVLVLALSAYDDPAYVQALYQAGANGYILKTAELADLLAALQQIASGHKVYDPSALDLASHQVPVEGLTDRELEVLQQAGEGLTNKQIGEALFISARTVQGHLQNIYQKLGVSTRTEAVALALRSGLINPNS